MPSDTPTPEEKQRRAALLDRIYRRISRLDDAELAELDAITAAAESDEPPGDPAPEAAPEAAHVNRRRFLLWLLLGGSAAATGSAAILLSSSSAGEPPPTPTAITLSTPTLQGSPVRTPVPSATPGDPPDAIIAALEDELTLIRADRLALRAQLDAARSEAERLTAELGTNQQQVAYLQQLVGLYQQLEAVGLDDAIRAGMGPVGLALLAVESGRSLLEFGVTEAARLLASVEVQSPAIANGLIWLEEQVNLLATSLQNLENALSDLVEPVAPVAQQIGDFIGQVLDLLPFGVGTQIREGLRAIGDILTHIPEIVASINPLVITPLRQWVSPDEDKGLVPEVVEPISANLVNPAQQMVDQTDALARVYTDDLQTPVEAALAERSAIREQIALFIG